MRDQFDDGSIVNDIRLHVQHIELAALWHRINKFICICQLLDV